MNRWNIIGYAALWAGMVLALAFTGYERREREEAFAHAVQVNCNFGNQNRNALAAIIRDANRRTQTSRQRTPEQKRQAKEFYEQSLKALKPFDCDSLVKP